jgi:hypothetical protein
MDPISRLSKALAVIRRAASARQPGAGAPRPGAPAGPGARAGSDAELRVQIARRLRAIDPGDPHRRDVAVRVFLEQVLLHEFGPDAPSMPWFRDAVREVQQVMDADPRVKAELDAAILQLAGN